jgi:hypothetical protein
MATTGLIEILYFCVIDAANWRETTAVMKLLI